MFSFVIQRGTEEQPHSNLLLGLLIPCIIWLIFRELVQIGMSHVLSSYIGFYNILDWTQIVVLSMILTGIMDDDGALASEREQRTLLIATFIAWIRLLFVIGNFFFQIAVFNAALIQVCLTSNTSQEMMAPLQTLIHI